MLVAILVSSLVVLCVVLGVRRGAIVAPTEERSAPDGLAIALGAVAIALAELPLLRALPGLLGARVLSGDARSHMMVATAIARNGVARGWIDAYQGGFPLGPHYPSLAWLLDAALVRVGVDPALATQALGIGALLAVPAVAYAIAIRAGTGVVPALGGAVVLCWLAPDSPFLGGTEAYLVIGVVSQVTAAPLALALAGSVLTGRSTHAPGFLAAATILAHPQIALVTIVIVALACAALGSRAPWSRFALAALSALVVGVATYGPGIATLGVPFGWPPVLEWLILGFGVYRLEWWLVDGDLLDKGRVPILTAACAVAIVLLVARSRRAAPRAAVVAAVGSVVLSVSGVFLTRLGALGAVALTFVQPLRMVATIPAVAAALVVLATVELLAWAPAVGHALGIDPRRARAAVLVALAATAVFFGAVALPQKTRALSERAARDGGCGEKTPAGFDPRELASWLRALERGRLFYAEIEVLGECANRHELDLASAVPLASTPAAGGHVGTHYVAFRALHPERAGSAARAESLGVRYVLHVPEGAPREEDGWRVIHAHGDLGLSERVGGTDVVGLGCITARWTGSERALADASNAAIDGAPSSLDRPRSLIALDRGVGPVVREDEDVGACSVDGGLVVEQRREPGAYSAKVTTRSPVDVVVRAAAFPSWRVTVDGRETRWRRVLPGFFSVRVPPGTHEVLAETRPPLAYGAGIALALALVALAPRALTRLRDRRRARAARAPSAR